MHLRDRVAALLQTVARMTRNMLHQHTLLADSLRQSTHLSHHALILNTLRNPRLKSPTAMRQTQHKRQRTQRIRMNNQAARTAMEHCISRQHRRQLTGHNIHAIIVGMKIEAVLTHAGDTHTAATLILLIVSRTERTIRENAIVLQLIQRSRGQRLLHHLIHSGTCGAHLSLHPLIRGRAGKLHMHFTQRMVIVRVQHLLKGAVLHDRLQLVTVTEKLLQILTIRSNRHQVLAVLLRNHIPRRKHGATQQTRMHLIAALHQGMNVSEKHRLLIHHSAGAVLLRNKNHRRQRRITKTLRLTMLLSHRNHSNALIRVPGRVRGAIVGRLPGQGASFDVRR